MTERRTQPGCTKTPFQIAEGCLYDYKLNLFRLDTLRRELSLAQGPAMTAQSYRAHSRGGGTQDPVARRLERIESLKEEIDSLEKRTVPITRMIRDLNEDHGLKSSSQKAMFQLIEMRYFVGGKWREVAEALDISLSSLMDRRQKLVKCTMAYLGLQETEGML